MAAHKSFVDGGNLDTSWLTGGIQNGSGLQSASNSQNDTLFETQSQLSGLMDFSIPKQHRQQPQQQPQSQQQPLSRSNESPTEENRRLHQDHKTLKRSIDKASQESSSAYTLLQEKASKINLSINDLHADLKKLERAVVFDSERSRNSGIDVELKLMNIVNNLESKMRTAMTDIINRAIDNKLSKAVKDLENMLTGKFEEHADKDDNSARLVNISTGVSDLKTMVQGIQSEVSKTTSTSNKLNTALERIQQQPQQLITDSMPLPDLTSMQLTAPPMPDYSNYQKELMANVYVISLNHCITDHRTNSSMDMNGIGGFTMANAINQVNIQYPHVFDNGWPVPPSNVTTTSKMKTRGGCKKRQKRD